MNLDARMAPTRDFTNTKKPDRNAIAVYVGETSAGKSITLHSEKNDEDVVFIIPGYWLPVMTDEAVAGTDHADFTKVYCYEESP